MGVASATAPWLPPGGSCQTALRNRLTDEGRRTVGQEMQLDEWHIFRITPFNGKSQTFSYRCPSSVFFGNRFRRADCQKIQLSNFGMIATGNHNFERFAALCNAPGGSQGCFAPGNGGRLRASPTDSEDFGDNHSTKHSIARASGRQVGDPYGTPKIFDLQQPTYYTPSVRGGAKAAAPLGSPGCRPLRCNSTDNAFIYS